MSSRIARSGAVWISDDAKSREWLDHAVYSAIGNTEKNLKGVPQAVSKMVVDYLEAYPGFGESEWTTFCGRVDPAPPLPSDFSDIWNGPCPIYSGKKINETHMLVYIPATIDGKPFTLKKLGEIAKRFFPKTGRGFEYITPSIFDKLGEKSTESRWVLMTKDVLRGSRNKNYAKQRKIVARLAEKSLGYKVPDALEAATCILAQYFFDSKTRSFSNELWTYTRCEEEIQGDQVIVGGFTPVGLQVSCYNADDEFVGIAALRKL